MKRHRTAIALAACLGLAGCQIGPRSMIVASSHYSDAVRVATSEQLLVNLVRLRYRDIPVFLSVSSISTQFEFESDASIRGNIVSGGSDSAGVGVGVRYSERPTMTFSIMGGESFQKRMLEPLQTPAIALLAESGWREDRVLRLCTEAVNGLKNAPTASGPTPRGAPEFEQFREASRLIRSLTKQRLIEFEFETRREYLSAPLPASSVDGEHTVEAVKAGVEFERTPSGELALVAEKRRLVLRFSLESDASPQAARLRELLRLQPGQRRFELVRQEDSELDVFQPNQVLGEVAVDARSLVGVLYFLANGVHVPQKHLDDGSAVATMDARDEPFDWLEVLDDLFAVHSSKDRPKGAAVAVKHRDYWFYLAGDDASSKATFLLLKDLFSLQAGDVEEIKPVLTLPVGG
jgi:hypothetical protein